MIGELPRRTVRKGTGALLERLAGLERGRRLGPELPGGYERIYHAHVRKTGGTSLNRAFWGLAGMPREDWRRRRRIRRGGYVFVRHHRGWIEGGRYFFANSHVPLHALDLPPKTFRVTILRDPVRRLLSHYRMLLWARDDPEARTREPAWRALRPRFRWLGSSLDDFLDRLPRRFLLEQLYMFSEGYEVAEAAERIRACDAVCTTEELDADIAALSRRLDLSLRAGRERRTRVRPEFERSALERARSLLDPEYELLARVKDRHRATGRARP